MRLFVGLGNPGSKYEGNRHNIGFMVLDEMARRHGFSPWRRRFQGETSEGVLEGERIVLHLRQLGYTVREIAGYYGTSQAGLNRKLKKIFDRMADAIIAEHYRRYEAGRMLGDAEMEV